VGLKENETASSILQHRCGATAFVPFPRDSLDGSLSERFLAQVARHGACLAVGDRDRRISYAELERWSRAVAQELVALRIGPESRVALILEQGATSVAATIATLRAGAAYVPLDPGEPDARLRMLLTRVDANAILTDEGGAARVRELASDAPIVESGEGKVARGSELPSVPAGAQACIYFTSGSTGEPKGVLDSHRNILHNVMRYTDALEIGPSDRLSLVQSPSSSATVSSTFAALLNGAALFPFQLDRGNLGALATWLISERITVLHSVPSLLRRALAGDEVLRDVRVVRLEGDRSYGQDMAIWRRSFLPGTLIANGLGTTETGLCRQLRVPVESELEDGIMPVGYEMTDMEVSIVDGDGRPLGSGEVGEISVASEFLATGYWADGRLTASAFLPMAGRPGWRTYRTGDLGRLLPDGCLEYLGRRDGLSKVLGNRVEPAEVEAALASIPGVSAVAVRIVTARRGEGRVIAYVVHSAALEDKTLRAAAASRLPSYMCPSRYISLPELPIGATGKVDRSALPEPPPVASRAPREGDDPLEARVAAVFADVLGHKIDRDEDFFAAGGDSMAAVDVLLALEQETDRRLPLSLVLGAPTVAALTAELRVDSGCDGPTLYQLSTTGRAAPLVLVPSHHGHALSYALLGRRLDTVRPVWALDSGSQGDADETDGSIEALATRYIETLRSVNLTGPYVIGGFCFGGAVAYEMARQLIEGGTNPAGIYLLGVSPYDFPGLVPSKASQRWARSMTPVGKVGRSIRFAAGVTTPEGRGYVTGELQCRIRRSLDAISREGRLRRSSRTRRTAAAWASFGQYRGEPLAVPVTLVLPSWSLASYWTDPSSLWRDIGTSVNVYTVPGVERMMLSEPVVSEVAEILTRDDPTNAS